MILYNTLMGFCAGLILILMADIIRRATTRGHGVALFALGLPLTLLSAAMALTWPLTVNPPINIAFAEPSLMLGIMATMAGLTLYRNRTHDVNLEPMSWVVFSLGLMLATIASAIWSYNLVGDAPPQEPITGQFQGWENTTFGAVYMLAALGCLAAPWFRKRMGRKVMFWGWMLAGIFFLLFSVLNYRTHIGLLINLERGTNYRW